MPLSSQTQKCMHPRQINLMCTSLLSRARSERVVRDYLSFLPAKRSNDMRVCACICSIVCLCERCCLWVIRMRMAQSGAFAEKNAPFRNARSLLSARCNVVPIKWRCQRKIYTARRAHAGIIWQRVLVLMYAHNFTGVFYWSKSVKMYRGIEFRPVQSIYRFEARKNQTTFFFLIFTKLNFFAGLLKGSVSIGIT